MKRLALALVALLVAGCGEPGEPVEQAVAPVAPGETVLRGVVVDGSITPVANVTVAVAQGDVVLRTNTTTAGTWEFRGIAPGSHLLTATRTGYLASQTRVDVQEGAISDVVKVVLEADVSYRRPHVVAYQFSGQIECGVVASAPPPVGFVAVAACQVPNDATGTPITNDASMTVHPLDEGTPTYIQSELVWTATSELGRQFLFYLDELNRTGAGAEGPGAAQAPYTELKRVTGPSPLVSSLERKEMDRLGLGYDLQVRVFSWTSDPVPVGATFEQPFEVYTHVFYGFSPPAGWRFSADGPVEAPPA